VLQPASATAPVEFPGPSVNPNVAAVTPTTAADFNTSDARMALLPSPSMMLRATPTQVSIASMGGTRSERVNDGSRPRRSKGE
jgi:hypothetical protein